VHTLIIVLQAISALTLIVLMAVQTDKAEQGGVMGIGGADGRSTSEIDRLVGAERILKPLTLWMAGAFLSASILAAIPADKVTFVHFLVGVALYVVAMMFGGRVWNAVTGMNSNS
jgi:protein translocase SecG subunit